MKLTIKQKYQGMVKAQEKWIDDHGSNQAGYRALYCGVHGHTEDEADAIYFADVGALRKLREFLKRA